MKLNGTHQLLAYADGVNILRGSIQTLKENAKALVAATREIGLEVKVSTTNEKDFPASGVVLFLRHKGQLKCDGTRAETKISSFGETDESI